STLLMIRCRSFIRCRRAAVRCHQLKARAESHKFRHGDVIPWARYCPVASECCVTQGVPTGLMFRSPFTECCHVSERWRPGRIGGGEDRNGVIMVGCSWSHQGGE